MKMTPIILAAWAAMAILSSNVVMAAGKTTQGGAQVEVRAGMSGTETTVTKGDYTHTSTHGTQDGAHTSTESTQNTTNGNNVDRSKSVEGGPSFGPNGLQKGTGATVSESATVRNGDTGVSKSLDKRTTVTTPSNSEGATKTTQKGVSSEEYSMAPDANNSESSKSKTTTVTAPSSSSGASKTITRDSNSESSNGDTNKTETRTVSSSGVSTSVSPFSGTAPD